MSNKPKKMVRNSCLDEPKEFVWNPCLDEPMQSKPKAIRSMVNAKYMRNLPLESARAAKELAKYIIK